MKTPPVKHILLEQHKAIYLPIPKVANSSIKWCLIDSLNMNIKSGREHSCWNRVDLAKANDLVLNKGYVSFVVVRNPFDRFVSCWRQKVASKDAGKGLLNTNSRFKQGMSLEDFAEVALSYDHDQANNHYKPQYKFITYANHPIYTHLIRFEDLSDGWDNFRESIKETNNLILNPLPHKNKSDNDNGYRELIKPDLREKLEKYYEKDLEILKYEF